MSLDLRINRDRCHPLAPVAARLCTANGHPKPDPRGAVACLSCWGEAIRRDERVRIEEGLPAEAGEDPTLVDTVAVERFLAGEAGKPRLTRAEKVAAAKRLLAGGASRSEAQRRLGISTATWRQLTAVIYAGAPLSSLT